MIIEGITVFAALFTLDFVWARYTQAITARWPWQASGYAGVIIGLSGFAAISYTTNPWMLLPAIAGAVTGTYSAVRFT